MVKILLINPPQKLFPGSLGFNLVFPIGLLSIAARIRKECNLFFMDCLMEDFKISKYKDHILYGMTFDKIEKNIKRINPDLVAISVPYSSQSENAIAISEICRKIDKKIFVIFGGADATVRYDYFLNNNFCDFCVIGEGEDTFLDIIKTMPSLSSMKKCKGIAYKSKNKIILNKREYIKDLDVLPFPAYDLIEVKSYLRSKYLYRNRSIIPKNSMSIITSRGCPYNCIFCSISLHMGKKFRFNSPGYVLDHLRFLKEEYEIRNIHFEDDNLTFDKKRFENILDGMIMEKMAISWDTPNGVRLDTLDFGLLKKIKLSGCKHLIIAIESGEKKILNSVIKKNLDLNHAYSVAKQCKSLGIRLSAFYIIGLPGEKICDMEKTTDLALHLLKSYDVIPQLNLATPLFGTPLYELCINKKYIRTDLENKDLSGGTQIYGEPLISTKEFNKKQLKHVLKEYQKKLYKELLTFAIKHPLFSLKRIIKNPDTLRRVF